MRAFGMGTGAFAVWMDVGRASLAREEVWQHPSLCGLLCEGGPMPQTIKNESGATPSGKSRHHLCIILR